MLNKFFISSLENLQSDRLTTDKRILKKIIDVLLKLTDRKHTEISEDIDLKSLEFIRKESNSFDRDILIMAQVGMKLTIFYKYFK